MRVINGTVYVLRDMVDEETRRPVPGVLSRLMQHNDIPVKQAYWIAKFARKMNEAIADIEGQRNSLIRKYGVEKDGGFSVEPGGENWAEFVKEHNDLMDIEIDLDVQTVKIPDNVNIPLGDLMLLDPFIEVITV